MHNQPITEDTQACVNLIRDVCGLYLFHPASLWVEAEENEAGVRFVMRTANDDMRKCLGSNKGETFAALTHLIDAMGKARGVPQRVRLLEPDAGFRRGSYPTFNAEGHDPQPTADVLKTLVESVTDDQARVDVSEEDKHGELPLSYLFAIQTRSAKNRDLLNAVTPDARNGLSILAAIELILQAAGHTHGVSYKVSA